MASEAFDCAKFIAATLSADPLFAGGVFPGLAPLGTPRPYAVYNLQGGTDTLALDGSRATSRPRFSVLVVTDGDSFSPGSAMAERADQLLHQARAAWPAAPADPEIVVTVLRESEMMYPEYKSDIRYNFHGGVYTFTAQLVNLAE